MLHSDFAAAELFPAADEEQWEFIQRVIDDCDYYLLIIGGRYGSVTADGISYTEKEFDYAVKKELKVVALIHGIPDDIPFGKSEQDPELREKLLGFRDKVMNGRLIKFWKNAEELPGLVALSLQKTIKMYPATGWVRANNIASEDILIEINNLRKVNNELKDQLQKIQAQEKPIADGIADIDSTVTIHGTYKTPIRYGDRTDKFEYSLSWRDLFALISPYLVEHPNDISVKLRLASNLKKQATSSPSGQAITIDDQEFKTITVQLKAYGLITTKYSQTVKGGMALFWSLTKAGERLMIESRVIRSNT